MTESNQVKMDGGMPAPAAGWQDSTQGMQQRIQYWKSVAPDSVFVEDARSERRVSYGELAAQVERTPRRNEPVALRIADPLTFATTYVALIASGATVLPLDPKAPEAENRRLMAQARVKDVVESVPAGSGSTAGGAAGTTGGSAMLFSSGSTGKRKLIRLDESRLLTAARFIAGHHELGPGERGYNSLPLHHINAEVVGVLAALWSGATIVLDAAFHRTGFWKLMAERNITWINAVPAIIAILAGESSDQYDTSKIRFVRSASAPLSRAVLERFEHQHRIPVIETYGMTEAASQITANPLHDQHKAGSAGRPVGVEVRVSESAGHLCKPNQVGTVEIRGESVITSYVNGVAAERFDADGWLDTGDQGFFDDDGYLFLVGRTDDVINNGGEKIFPREIEEVLMRDSAVGEVMVVPLEDDIKGQVPVALVKGNGQATGERIVSQLHRLCDDVLPKPMRPVEIVVLDDLPRGATGKLSRRIATERAAELVNRR
jgi:oxalate---CoA ligase